MKSSTCINNWRWQLLLLSGLLLLMLMPVNTWAQDPVIQWETYVDGKTENMGVVESDGGQVFVTSNGCPYSSDDGYYGNLSVYTGCNNHVIRYDSEGHELYREEGTRLTIEPLPYLVGNVAVRGASNKLYFLGHGTNCSYCQRASEGEIGGSTYLMPDSSRIPIGAGDGPGLYAHYEMGTKVKASGATVGYTTYVEQTGNALFRHQTVWRREFTKATPAGVNLRGSKSRGAAIDATGNVFLVAQSFVGRGAGSLYKSEQSILKYSASGTLAWSNHFNYGAARTGIQSGDVISEVALDERGDVYFCGVGQMMNSAGNPTVPFVFMTKFSNAGTLLWRHTQEFATGTTVANAHIAVLNSGAVYMAYSLGNVTKLVKYGSSGAVVWNQPSTDVVNTQLRDIGVDSEGNVYMVKSAYLAATAPRSTSTLRATFGMLKYNASGEVTWSGGPADTGVKYMINKMYIRNDNLYLVGSRQASGAIKGTTIRVNLRGFYLPDAPWYGVLPDLFLNPYDNFTTSLLANQGRGGSFTNLGIGWTFRSENPSYTNLYNAALLTSTQSLWSKDFTKPPTFQLPGTALSCTFRLSVKETNQYSELISVSDNLVKLGVKEIVMVMTSDTKELALKVTTDGAQVPFTITAYNFSNNAVWSGTYVAPIDTKIIEKIYARVKRISVTGASQGAKMISYYPNPSSGKFLVEVNENISLPGELTLFSMDGAVVFNQMLTNTRKVDVNVPHKAGLYILRFRHANGEEKQTVEIR